MPWSPSVIPRSSQGHFHVTRWSLLNQMQSDSVCDVCCVCAGVHIKLYVCVVCCVCVFCIVCVGAHCVCLCVSYLRIYMRWHDMTSHVCAHVCRHGCVCVCVWLMFAELNVWLCVFAFAMCVSLMLGPLWVCMSCAGVVCVCVGVCVCV